MPFELIDEYSDRSNNSFNLEPSLLVGNPPEQPNSGDKHLPNIDLYDPFTEVDDFHKFMDQNLQQDIAEDHKTKIKDKYDLNNTDEAVNAAIDNKVPMVVHIGAPWCAPCQRMEKNVWPGVEKDLKGKAVFVHLDGDAILNANKGSASSKALAKDVESFPTIRVVMPSRGADGKVTFKSVAENTAEMSDSALRKMLKNAKVGG